MFTEGGACFAGHPKGWIPLQGFLRSIRLCAAEPRFMKYSTANPTDLHVSIECAEHLTRAESYIYLNEQLENTKMEH